MNNARHGVSVTGSVPPAHRGTVHFHRDPKPVITRGNISVSQGHSSTPRRHNDMWLCSKNIKTFPVMFLFKVAICWCLSVPYWARYKNWQLWRMCLLHLTVTSTCRIKTKKNNKKKNPEQLHFCIITIWLSQIILYLANVLYHFWWLLQHDWE